MNIKISKVSIEIQRQNEILSRIADALDRLAPPPLPDRQPTKSTLADLHFVSPLDNLSRQQAKAEWGIEQSTVPGTEAFYAKVHQYEEDVLRDYGQAALESLPWRKQNQ